VGSAGSGSVCSLNCNLLKVCGKLFRHELNKPVGLPHGRLRLHILHHAFAQV
jgi:hypothetical protein